MKTKLEMELEITQEIIDAIVEKMIASGDCVPVVRCHDCEHWEIDWAPSTAAPYIHYCGMVAGCTQPNHYCGFGERRKTVIWNEYEG